MLYKYLRLGGVATFLKMLITALKADGYAVYLATGADEHNAQTRSELEALGATIIPVPFSENRLVLLGRFLRMLWVRHAALQLNLIHSHHRLTHLAGKLFSMAAGVPLLLTIHEFKYDQKQATTLWKREMMTVPSRALKDHMVQEYSVQERLVRVIPNAIAQVYDVDPERIAPLKEQFFGDEKATYITFIGRIAREKGVDTIVESIPIVKKQQPGIEFRIVGDGPLRETLALRCRELGYRPEDIFIGPHRTVNELLFLTDIAVSPSRSESFSIFALEAMRAGKPIIAGRVGGLPEVVTDHKTGRLIAPGNPEELAQTIVELAVDHDRRKQYGLAAQARFHERFTAEKFAEAYRNVYTKLIAS